MTDDRTAFPAGTLPLTQNEVYVLLRMADAFGDLNPGSFKRLAKIAERSDEDIEILLEIVDDHKSVSWAKRSLKTVVFYAGTILAGMVAWKTFFNEK